MSYKIAVGTSDGERIDLHFGEIESVSVYEVDERTGGCTFLESREIVREPGSEAGESGCSCGRGFAEGVAAAVGDCAYFLVAKIGNRPHRMLQEGGVNCIEAPFAIAAAAERLNGYFSSHRKRELHVF